MLARSLEPLPEESLPGYLLRLGHRLDRSPGRVAALCGLNDRHDRIPIDYLLALPSAAADVFAGVARLSTSEIKDLALRRFAGTYPALARTRSGSGQATAFYSDAWALSFSSRYCPACLTGDASPIQRAFGGPWKLRWHLPVVFACPLHHQLLESICPDCGNLLNRPDRSRAALIQLSSRNKLHPLQCRNSVAGDGRAHRHRPLCGARLDQDAGSAGAQLPTEDLDRMIALQKRLDQRLVPMKLEASHGSRPDSSYFLDLVAASQLIKLSWPAGRALAPSDTVAALIDGHAAPINAALQTKLNTVGTYPRVPALWSAPDDTAQCGALLLTAEVLLADHDLAALRERVHPLARAAMERPSRGGYRSFFHRSEFSPIFARALARQVHGFHAAGGKGHARLRVPSRDCRFTAEEVPPLLPQTWYDTYFRGFTDRMANTTNWTVRHLRRAASLKLVEMTAGGSWGECAESLGHASWKRP